MPAGPLPSDFRLLAVKTYNIRRLYRTVEDRLFPALQLGSHERAIYYHLLRHTRLEGRRRVRFSKAELARATGLCPTTVRHYVGSLARTPCVKVLERGENGLLLEVLVPEEMVELKAAERAPLSEEHGRARRARNHFRDDRVREKIFLRERGRCFYCLRRLRPGAWALDHVVPLAAGGDNSPQNAVASCHECNCAKGESPAPIFLRSLFRNGALSRTELRSQLAVLKVRRAYT